jgi:protein-tyrosine phosphatase
MSAQLAPVVRLLTVCTGNVCRSPYAALRLESELNRIRPGRFVVTSAGTHALVGAPVDSGSAKLLVAQGISVSGFRGTRLTSEQVRGHDAVLVMTDEHRELVIEEAPFAFRKIRPIREFAHLLDVIGAHADWPTLLAEAGAGTGPAGRWRALPDILAVQSRHIRRRRRDQHVTDPYGRPAKVFEAMQRELDEAIDVIVAWEASFPA